MVFTEETGIRCRVYGRISKEEFFAYAFSFTSLFFYHFYSHLKIKSRKEIQGKNYGRLKILYKYPDLKFIPLFFLYSAIPLLIYKKMSERVIVVSQFENLTISEKLRRETAKL